MGDFIFAIYFTDVDPQNPEYTKLPHGLWIRVADVTFADDELAAGQDGARDGEAFINTVHTPIA